jgi:hypothetical protein
MDCLSSPARARLQADDAGRLGDAGQMRAGSSFCALSSGPSPGTPRRPACRDNNNTEGPQMLPSPAPVRGFFWHRHGTPPATSTNQGQQTTTDKLLTR